MHSCTVLSQSLHRVFVTVLVCCCCCCVNEQHVMDCSLDHSELNGPCTGACSRHVRAPLPIELPKAAN